MSGGQFHYFTIFDFVGVTDFHGDDEDEVAGGPIVVGEQRKQPFSDRRRGVVTLDVEDHIDPASRDWFTLDENGRIAHTEAHEARAAELGLRFAEWRGGREFDAEQARWAALIESRIRADAETIDRFGDYDFDKDPFAALGGYKTAARVFGGRGVLRDLLASLNAAVFGAKPRA